MISPFAVSGIPRIIFGEGRLAEIPGLLARYGRRVLVVTGSRSLECSPNWDRLSDSMGESGLSWDLVKVEGEPSPELVDDAVSRYRSASINSVLGIGGGSAIDAAKAIAALLPFGNSVMDHIEGVGRSIPYEGPPTPWIAVPTTAGTGAEATRNAVLSRQGPEGFKRSFRHDSLVPAVAVVDPTLGYGCPRHLTAAAGMDALTQLLEGYVSTGANAFTDALAESGLAAARDGLLPACQDDPAGRNAMAYGGLLSGVVLTHAGLGIIHGLASPLGAYFPIPHGTACAALLVAATRQNIAALRKRAPESPASAKYAKLGALLSGRTPANREAAWAALIETLSGWIERLGIPGLRDYGVGESDLEKIALGCTAKTNPVPLAHAEMIGILRESL